MFLFLPNLSPYFLLTHPPTNQQLLRHTHTRSWAQLSPGYRSWLPKCPSTQSRHCPSSALHLEWRMFLALTKTPLAAPCPSPSRAAAPPLWGGSRPQPAHPWVSALRGLTQAPGRLTFLPPHQVSPIRKPSLPLPLHPQPPDTVGTLSAPGSDAQLIPGAPERGPPLPVKVSEVSRKSLEILPGGADSLSTGCPLPPTEGELMAGRQVAARLLFLFESGRGDFLRTGLQR